MAMPPPRRKLGNLPFLVKKMRTPNKAIATATMPIVKSNIVKTFPIFQKIATK